MLLETKIKLGLIFGPPAALALHLGYQTLVPDCDELHAAVKDGTASYSQLVGASHCDPEGEHKGFGSGLFRAADELRKTANSPNPL